MLNIYNTLTRKVEPFKVQKDMTVKMYTCGPSTYQPPHIGNYRTFLFEDVLQRYLEYLGYKVRRLITLTNIEDKAIAEAQKEGISVDELTNRNEAAFFKALEQLSIKRPDYSVRASTILDQALILTKTLLSKGTAYKYMHKGAQNVYFEPQKFPGFGRLAHLDMNKWPKKKRRFHLDTYPGMPWNKGDFILWRGCRSVETVCWDTDLGRGRPAWNIQDAAMVTKHLGCTVDLACGGIDNLVRHHDYTMAIAEAASDEPFAKYWLHGGHLYVNGKKMSKSTGNVIYPEGLTAKNYNNEQIRFFLIYGAYRKKMNFTWQNLARSSKKLANIKNNINELQKNNAGHSTPQAKTLAHNFKVYFQKNMDNDLDVKSAFDTLHRTTATLRVLSQKGKLGPDDAKAAITDLRVVDRVLQVLF